MQLGDTGVNFEQLVVLARSDPERFERVRELLIERAIARLPKARRDRLRCLQWRIDQTRRIAPNAYAANLSLSAMMWGSLDRLSDLLNGSALSFEQADVLPFSPSPRR